MWHILRLTGLLIVCLAISTQAADPVMTDVFVPADDGFAVIRIPSVVMTTHHVLLAFAEGRAGGKSDQAENKIIAKRSTDGGLSWSRAQVLAGDGDNSLNNPTSVVDHQTGRVFLMYQRIPAHTTETSKSITTGLTGPMIYRNFLLTSDDDGKTWSAPLDVTEHTKHPTLATTVASGPGIGIQLIHGPHKGRLIFPFNEGPYYKWNNYAVFSDNDGATWAAGQNAPDNMLGKKSRVNEVQMVELEDGSVMLNSRQFAGAKCRKIAISHDGGESWSPIEDSPELRDPSCMASILRYSFAEDGHPGILLYSGPDSSKRQNGTIRLSKDDGKTWPIKRTLLPGSFSYSVLVKLDEANIGCLFESDDKILFARFTLDWINGGLGK
jgi:sialidase-1